MSYKDKTLSRLQWILILASGAVSSPREDIQVIIIAKDTDGVTLPGLFNFSEPQFPCHETRERVVPTS